MFANTPEPPYTAVIFTSRRTAGDDDQYGLMAERMEEMAVGQRGYLGIESARDAQGAPTNYLHTPVALARDDASYSCK